MHGSYVSYQWMAKPLSASSISQGSQKIALGLLERKPRWGLSARGWLWLMGLSLGVAVLVAFCLHPFLSVTHRLDTDILVVEGWVHGNIIRAAAAEYTNGSYRRVFTTGGPVHGSASYVNDFNTAASVGADLLKAAGLPPDVVQMVPCRVKDRDRTFSSALALGAWFQTNNVSVTRVNVVSEGVHARRTWYLYQKALGPKVSVGIICFPDEEYPPDRWWRYSEGVRDTLGELIAYLYARFFFWPRPS